MYPKKFQRAKIAILLGTTLLLGGCIGSSNNQNPVPLQTGDAFTVTKRVDGHQVMLDTYRILALTDSGQLSSTPVADDAAQPHFAVLESRQLNPMPVVYTISSSTIASGGVTPAVLMDTTVPFTESLLSAYRTYFGGISAQEAASHLRKLGLSLDGIYADYTASGFGSLNDYIAFYTAVDQYGPDSSLMTEADAKNFIDITRMNQAKFLQFLSNYGVTWQELLTQMKAKAYSFDMLQQAYAHSGESLGNYLAGFVHGGTGNLGGSLADDNNVVSEAAALGYAVMQYSWYNIDQNGKIQTAAHGYWSDVLSSQDTDISHYNYISLGNTDNVEYIVQNNPHGEYIWTQVADVGFNLGYSYNAINPAVPNSYWFALLTLNVNKNNVRGWDWIDNIYANDEYYHHSLKASITNVSAHESPQGNSVDVTVHSDFHIFARSEQAKDSLIDMHFYDDWEVNSHDGQYSHSSSQSGQYTCRPDDDYDCQSTTP